MKRQSTSTANPEPVARIESRSSNPEVTSVPRKSAAKKIEKSNSTTNTPKATKQLPKNIFSKSKFQPEEEGMFIGINKLESFHLPEIVKAPKGTSCIIKSNYKGTILKRFRYDYLVFGTISISLIPLILGFLYMPHVGERTIYIVDLAAKGKKHPTRRTMSMCSINDWNKVIQKNIFSIVDNCDSVIDD